MINFLSYKRNSNFEILLQNLRELVKIKLKEPFPLYSIKKIIEILALEIPNLSQLSFHEDKTNIEFEEFYKLSIPLSKVSIKSSFFIIYSIIMTELLVVKKEPSYNSFEDNCNLQRSKLAPKYDLNLDFKYLQEPITLYTFQKKDYLENTYFNCESCLDIINFLTEKNVSFKIEPKYRLSSENQLKFNQENDQLYNFLFKNYPLNSKLTFPKLDFHGTLLNSEEIKKLFLENNNNVWIYYLITERINYKNIKLSEVEKSICFF